MEFDRVGMPRAVGRGRRNRDNMMIMNLCTVYFEPTDRVEA